MNNDFMNIEEQIISNKKKGIFDVLIIGTFDKLFSQTFSLEINDPNIKHKYLNSYNLRLREQFLFPKNFLHIFYPEIIDKLMNIDILILGYEKSDLLSFEYIKTFYQLYYKQLTENERPKNILIFERNNIKDNNNKNNNKKTQKKVDINDGKKVADLYNNGIFCDCNTNEELFDNILIKCIDNLKQIYNTENFNLYNFDLKDKSNNFHFSIYGHKDLQNIFLKYLLKLKYNQNYQKKNDNYYIVNYKNEINNEKINCNIILQLMDEKDYSYDSQCFIFLYDKTKINTFNLIRNLIRSHIFNYGAKQKKINKLFSINTTNSLDYNDNTNEGQKLAKEIGANFNIINHINEQNEKEYELINNVFNNIIKEIFEYININNDSNKIKKDFNKSKTNNQKNTFFLLSLDDSPNDYIDKFNNKINNEIQNYNKDNYIFNLCPHCYNYMNIQIKDNSNIIILKCDNCNKEPKGLNIYEYEFNKNNINRKLYCNKCYKCLFYDYSSTKLICLNCQNIHKSLKTVSIPIYLKNYYCEIHNEFHKYYLKYSKKGLCDNCYEEKIKKGYFIEQYNKKDTQILIKNKKIELEKEKKFFKSIKEHFKKCIKDIEMKFNEMIEIKENIYNIKKNMIKNLELIQNNYILISNVENLKFNYMKNYKYNENDSFENKIKSIFNILKIDEDIDNYYFDKIKDKNISLRINGPYNNLVSQAIEEKNERNFKVTDIWSINNNKFICISFDNGKVKIYDSNIDKSHYPIYIINEYDPLYGVNSLYASKNKDNQEIIYLCGYESIKIISMNENYTSHKLLYEIIEPETNFYQVIEISLEKDLLLLNNFNIINLIRFENDIYSYNNQITIEVTNVFINEKENDYQILSLNKIGKNMICLKMIEAAKMQLKEKLDKSSLRITLIASGNSDNDNEDIGTKNVITKIYKYDFNFKKKDNDNIIIISKEYSIPNNYELLGVLSEEDYLLLMSYKKANEDSNNISYLCIFDFNICQFIKSFIFHNSASPQALVKMGLEQKAKNIWFIICDENLSLHQYSYDKDNNDVIFYVKSVETTQKINNRPIKLLYLKPNIIIFCNNYNYYLLSA